MCVLDHSYACVYMGVGHTDSKAAQHFASEKLTIFYLVLRMGFEPLVFGSRVDALPIEPPRHPLGKAHMHSSLSLRSFPKC